MDANSHNKEEERRSQNKASMIPNGSNFGGCWFLSIKYLAPKPIHGTCDVSEKQEKCVTAFVGNLTFLDVDGDALREAFKQDCGAISQV
jgi:hypothetical protein